MRTYAHLRTLYESHLQPFRSPALVTLYSQITPKLEYGDNTSPSAATAPATRLSPPGLMSGYTLTADYSCRLLLPTAPADLLLPTAHCRLLLRADVLERPLLSFRGGHRPPMLDTGTHPNPPTDTSFFRHTEGTAIHRKF